MRRVAKCYATTGNSIIKTTDGGKTWTTALRVTAPTVVSVLSCATAQNCVAGGNRELVLRTIRGLVDDT